MKILRSTVFYTFSFSFIVHVVLLSLLWPSSAQQKPTVSIKIEYRHGSQKVATQNRVVKQSGIHQLKASTDINDEAIGESVLGESVGVRAIYPRISRELGEEGSVFIEIRSTVDGEYAFKLKEPSATHERLQEAALNAVRISLENGGLKPFLENKKEVTLTFIFRLSPRP